MFRSAIDQLLKLAAIAVLLHSCPLVSTAQSASTHERVVAPYLDMGKPYNNVPVVQSESGTRWTTLAFINAGNGCEPAWPGNNAVRDDKLIHSYVMQAKRRGGKITLAFGGYEGTELAMACPDAKSLANAYLQAARRYTPEVLDFDVEHFAIEDQASIERRSAALALLTRSNPKLRIQFTLPATPKGLTAQSINVLQSAMKHDLKIYIVNVMAMDYAIPMPDGGMGAAAISSIDGTRDQLRQLGLKTRIGITPMIGVNDSPGETFTLADAQQVVEYAKQHEDVSLLAFWSLGRDNGTCAATVSPTCSGIAQHPWAFTRLFLNFH